MYMVCPLTGLIIDELFFYSTLNQGKIIYGGSKQTKTT